MTQTANDIQVGGNHYREKPYQHWDFVGDANLHYYLGCATKYPSRWRTKYDTVEKQKEDLSKAVHYIRKAQERRIYADMESYLPYLPQFKRQFHHDDAYIISCICHGEYDAAIKSIEIILDKLEG